MEKLKMRLQGIGLVNGTYAKNIKVGNTLIWNYGCESLVEQIEFSKTGKTLTIKESIGNKVYDRKLSANRLVCVK